jgi:hypothetical protein
MSDNDGFPKAMNAETQRSEAKRRQRGRENEREKGGTTMAMKEEPHPARW